MQIQSYAHRKCRSPGSHASGHSAWSGTFPPTYCKSHIVLSVAIVWNVPVFQGRLPSVHARAVKLSCFYFVCCDLYSHSSVPESGSDDAGTAAASAVMF
jgi:hypothetical protein